MSKIVFEHAKWMPSQGSVPGASTAHGIKHTVEVEDPLTQPKLAQAELQFLFWFQANNPGCELLEWAAKDAATGTVFSQYRSHVRAITERVEIQKNLVRQHDELIDRDSRLTRLKLLD
ncbi:hypothetical protein J2Y55_005837 [Bosea sp. BE125]|uniref:hypothetical protein n=1 Tax=Bosea sp. BE125 TaxID=2817909 RepID=UPI00285F1B82|nr:hypothetical protein [Bosea sp. BE125]MDR6874799.1 hypothetical protein [Bosea sp. BE125]